MIHVLALLGQDYTHEPFANYVKETYYGFSVYVSAAARRNNDTTQPALNLLSKQIEEMIKLVPEESLRTLRRVPVFVEFQNPGTPCACYHVDKGWLKENGYILEKENAVEISNTKNYVDWIKLNQPYMTLHEFSHGYHDLLFTHNDAYIGAVYKNAVASGKYEKVAHNRGSERRAYALNNQAEYFAELSEAYFGRNDYYPFNRAELKEFDPKGYEMIERCWKVRS